jgi:hypothetical protein
VRTARGSGLTGYIIPFDRIGMQDVAIIGGTETNGTG